MRVNWTAWTRRCDAGHPALGGGRPLKTLKRRAELGSLLCLGPCRPAPPARHGRGAGNRRQAVGHFHLEKRSRALRFKLCLTTQATTRSGKSEQRKALALAD